MYRDSGSDQRGHSTPQGMLRRTAPSEDSVTARAASSPMPTHINTKAAPYYQGAASHLHVIPEEQLARGSFGDVIDSYIGRAPLDGPPGFTFRKVTYAGTALDGVTVHGSYRATNDHYGLISSLSSGGVRSHVKINQDQTGGTDIAGEARLEDGDIILGSIMQLIDERSQDDKTGTITIGMVPVANGNPFAGNTMYGVFNSTNNDASVVNALGIGGSRSVSASACSACSVHNIHLNLFNPNALDTTSGRVDSAYPSQSIVVSGITPASSASSLKFVLHVYALVGARAVGLAESAVATPDFMMADLGMCFAKHSASIIHS